MLNQIRNRLFWLMLLAASSTASTSAAQAKNILLPLVPSGTEIVSGIANPETSGASGRLLMVTDSNNRDFEDCLALLGIDGERSIEQVIEAASSSSSGEMSEHLLLLAGSFKRPGIYKGALKSGGTSLEHSGVGLVAIAPFQREQRRFNGVRWLAILDERILVFGTPAMVGNALDRYMHHDEADPVLVGRLGQMHVDVDSWSVIAMPPAMLERHLGNYPLSTASKAALKDADEFAMGVHYGRYDRVDFVFHIRELSESVEGRLSKVQLIPANLRSVKQFHLDKDPADSDRLRGSFRVRNKELDRWLSSVDKTTAEGQQMENNKSGSAIVE